VTISFPPSRFFAVHLLPFPSDFIGSSAPGSRSIRLRLILVLLLPILAYSPSISDRRRRQRYVYESETDITIKQDHLEVNNQRVFEQTRLGVEIAMTAPLTRMESLQNVASAQEKGAPQKPPPMDIPGLPEGAEKERRPMDGAGLMDKSAGILWLAKTDERKPWGLEVSYCCCGVPADGSSGVLRRGILLPVRPSRCHETSRPMLRLG
jgi:hypothetical protein